MNEVALKPSYWASVSGGKDSLYMLNLILHNQDKYPLSGVIHFELEIDYPFIKNVIEYMESECKKYGIPFIRIKPRKSWYELYEKYKMPNRMARWCNSKYKMDAKIQFDEMQKKIGYNAIYYIGYCVDEEKRYSYKSILNERYPLVEENIYESTILEWAKNVPLYNDYYKFVSRCGCMYCPMNSMASYAYLYKYYPENYNFLMNCLKETEEFYKKKKGSYKFKGDYSIEYLDYLIKTKYVPILETTLKSEQISLFKEDKKC